LGSRGKKCIFLVHLEHSKGNVFIEDSEDGSFTKIESRDATFLKNDFPKKAEVDKDSQLHELGDPEPSVPPIGCNEESNTLSQTLDPSGSNTHESIP